MTHMILLKKKPTHVGVLWDCRLSISSTMKKQATQERIIKRLSLLQYLVKMEADISHFDKQIAGNITVDVPAHQIVDTVKIIT